MLPQWANGDILLDDIEMKELVLEKLAEPSQWLRNSSSGDSNIH